VSAERITSNENCFFGPRWCIRAMGSGTSILSPEDSAVLTQILKEEYDKLNCEGLTEHDIQLRLTSKYNEIIASMSSNSAATRPDSTLGEARARCRRQRNLHGTAEPQFFYVLCLLSPQSENCSTSHCFQYFAILCYDARK
jgi:hypothetical protein